MIIRRFLIFSVLLLTSLQLNALEMVEGEWELVVKQNVSGMPVGIPPTHHRECFTEADPIPTSFLKARSCDVIEQRVVYRTVHYKINCFTENGSVINEGKIRFGARKISGSSKTNLGDVAGRNTVLRYKFKGRRIGECH
ncbi:MAG: hypothetical protein PVF28_00305 [Thioalkalispiraceae bacterium]